MNEIEIVKQNGGAREGAGRPVGSKTAKTRMKEKVLAEIQDGIFKMAKKIVNAQAIAAIGTHKMVQMMKGPGDTVMTRTIRDEEEMQRLLDEGVYGIDYVIVVGKDPDYKAGDALLNRAFGRPKETVEIQSPVTTDDEKRKTGDQAIIDYLSGKRGFEVPKQNGGARATTENTRANTL